MNKKAKQVVQDDPAVLATIKLAQAIERQNRIEQQKRSEIALERRILAMGFVPSSPKTAEGVAANTAMIANVRARAAARPGAGLSSSIAEGWTMPGAFTLALLLSTRTEPITREAMQGHEIAQSLREAHISTHASALNPLINAMVREGILREFPKRKGVLLSEAGHKWLDGWRNKSSRDR